MSSPDSDKRYTPVRQEGTRRITDALLLFSGGEVPPHLRSTLSDREKERLEVLQANEELKNKQARRKIVTAQRVAAEYEKRTSSSD